MRAAIAEINPKASSETLGRLFQAVMFMRARATLAQHEGALGKDSLDYLVAAQAWINLATADPLELDKRALRGRERIVGLLEHLLPDPEERENTVEKVASTLGVIITERSIESVTADDKALVQNFLGDASIPINNEPDH